MTVREWFRKERGRFWEKDPSAASDIDEIVTTVIDGGSPYEGMGAIRVGYRTYLIADYASYAERDRVYQLVNQRLREAMRRRILCGGLSD